MTLISAKNLSVRMGKKVILEPFDFSIDEKEIVTIVGPNGAGKTSFLRVLIGATPPASGQLITRPGLRVGYVPQKLHIDSGLPITTARFLNLPQKAEKKILQETIEFTGISGLLSLEMRDLSGGEFQRILLARALLQNPHILVLDEATRGLDHLAAAAFYQQIELARNGRGCAVLMVSHELHVVMAASDRVVCLNGHICCQGSPEQVAITKEYKALFGDDAYGTMALYRHDHDHHHHDHNNDHHHHDHLRQPTS